MILRASRSADAPSGKYRHTAGRTALSALLTFVLAISMLPILPSNPLGDHSVPAYAADGEEKTHPDLNEHVFSNLDPAYVDVPENQTSISYSEGQSEIPQLGTPYSHVYATYSIFDEAMSQGYTDLQDIWTKTGGAFIASYPVNMPIYDINPDSDYLVMFMDVDGVTENAKFVYADWNTHDIDNPISLNDQIHYDIDAGIAYIPRNGFVFDEDNAPQNAEDGLAIQAQMVYSVNLEEENDPYGKIDVAIENNNPNVTAVSPQMTIESPLLDITTSFQLTTSDTSHAITAEDIEIYPNATTEPMRLVYSGEGQNITYNPETGVLGLAVSPMNLVDLKIVIKDNTKATEQAYGSGSYGNTTLHDPWDMWQVPGTKLTAIDPDTLQSGQLFWYKGHMNAVKSDVKNHASTGYCYEVSFGGSYGAIVKWFYNERGTNGLDYSRIGPQMNKGISGLDAEGLRVSDAAYHSLMDHPTGVCYGNAGVSQDFTGDWNWDQFATVCGHQSDGTYFPRDYETQSSNKYWDVWLYVRCIYKAEDYLTLAFQVPIVDGQQAVGIYRIAYEGRGWIELDKTTTADAKWTENNKNYSYRNAEYGVYRDAACTDLVTTMVTDASGKATSEKIKKGTYYVKEINAPAGYAITKDVIQVDIQAGQATAVSAAEFPPGISQGPAPGFAVEKMDYNRYIDKNGNAPQGAASLVGAKYKITYADGYYTTPQQVRDNVWSGWKSTIITTKLVGDRAIASYEPHMLLSDGKGGTTMPVGTYLVEEVQPPSGYHFTQTALENKTGYVVQATRDTQTGPVVFRAINASIRPDGTITKTGSPILDSNFNNTLISLDMPKRADISINKFVEITTDPDQYPDKKKPAAGVRFQIINNNDNTVKNIETGAYVPKGKAIYELETNEDGWASTSQLKNNANQTGQSSGALPIGKYIIREVDGSQPDGYDVIDDYPIEIGWNKKGDCELQCCSVAGVWNKNMADNKANSNTGGDRNLVFNDANGTVVKIIKVDGSQSDPAKQKPVRGEAKFQILDANKKVMTFDLPYPQSGTTDTLSTSIDGSVIIPDKLMSGTYYIREIAAPGGYLWSSKEMKFECSAQTTHDHGSYDTPYVVKFDDQPAKGRIEVTKTDSRNPENGVITSDETKFEVYAEADIVTEDGTVRAVAGELVDEMETVNGIATSRELFLGSYYVKEVKAPQDYLINNDRTSVELKYAGDRVAVTKATATVSDVAVKAKIGVEKRDTESGALIPISGVAFEIRAAENIVGGDGHVWHYADELIDTIYTDDTGRATSEKSFELGSYYAIEISAPYGYALNAERVPLIASYADDKTPEVQVWGTCENEPQNFEIEVSKLDRTTGKVVPVEGTEVDIHAAAPIARADGTVVHQTDAVVDTVTIDKTGKIKTTADDILVGNYYLKEKHAPQGYVLDTESTPSFRCEWDSSGAKTVSIEATISDNPAMGVIDFAKVDAETGLPVKVAGCTADVYAAEDIVTPDGTVRAKADSQKPVATLVTDENGHATSPKLFLGTYSIVERTAPEGYLINETPVIKTIKYENETTPVVSAATEIADENAMGTISISKRDQESIQDAIEAGIDIEQVPGLEGATFEVRAKVDIVTGDGTVRARAGEVVDTKTTGPDGTCTTDPLYLGIYTVTEIQAPTGYVLNTTPEDAAIVYKDQHTPITMTSKSIENAAQKGVISVTKTDSETGKIVLSAGATFEVRAKTDIIAGDGAVRAHAGEVVDSITTDETGIASTKALHLGTYEVYEVTAPEGYLLSDEVKEITLSYGDQTEPLVYEMTSVADAPVKGVITVTKEDSDLDEPLANVEYEVRAKEDVIGKDGTEWFKAGEVSDTLVTGVDGVATSKELPLGKYVVVETVQPNGYELDTTEYDAPLVYADQVTAVVHSNHFLYNQPASMFVKKVSTSDENKLLANTQFIGWEKTDEADIASPFGVFAPADYEIVSASVDYMGAFSVEVKENQGDIVKSFDLTKIEPGDIQYSVFVSDEKAEQGEYVMHLTYAAAGSQVTEDFKFVVNEHDTNAIFALGDIVAMDVERANCFGRTIATSESNDPVEPGQDANEPEDDATDVGIATQAEGAEPTDDDGGDSASNEGAVDDEGMPNASTEEGTEKNETDGSAKTPLQVADESKVAKRVPVFLTNGTFAYSVTGEDGLAEFKYIPQGEIGFAEYMPPVGYASDRTPQYATFTSEGVLEGAENAEKVPTEGNEAAAGGGDVIGLRFADDEIKLSISKRDVTTSEELPGNVLSVYKALSDGTVDTNGDIASEDYGDLIETWTSTNEPHMMQLLPRGSYILKEEQAVDGFTIAEDVKFQLNDTGVVQQVVMNNDHAAAVADELVATLGETGIPVPIALLLTFAGSAVFAAGYRRRQHLASVK